VLRSVKIFPKHAKITAILIIEDILEPSLCKGAPSGIATLSIYRHFHFSAASKLAGIVRNATT
jgi:hypothetical protein